MKNKTFLIGVLVIVAVFLILFLWGCQEKGGSPAEQTPEQISAGIARPFDAKATIRMKELVMTADVNKTSADTLTLAVREPKTLAGMTFAYDGRDITVSYLGMSMKLNQDSRLVSSAASLLVNAINKASKPGGIDVTMQNGALLVSGESESGKFTVALDKENGSLASVSLPEMDFECHFDDFIFKK